MYLQLSRSGLKQPPDDRLLQLVDDASFPKNAAHDVGLHDARVHSVEILWSTARSESRLSAEPHEGQA